MFELIGGMFMNQAKDDLSGKAEALAEFASNTPGMKTVQDLCEAKEGPTEAALWLSRAMKFVQVCEASRTGFRECRRYGAARGLPQPREVCALLRVHRSC